MNLLKLLALMLFLSPGFVQARVNIHELSQELMKVEQQEGEFLQITWFPKEYWKSVGENNPNISRQLIASLEEAFDKYIVFGVVNLKVTGDKLISINRKSMRLEVIDPSNNYLIETSINRIPEADKELLLIVKDILAQMAGNYGKSMELFVFSKGKNSGHAVNATSSGILKAVLNQNSYTWRLPIGSLMPAKYDVETNERFPGNYLYNPYTGKLLKQ